MSTTDQAVRHQILSMSWPIIVELLLTGIISTGTQYFLNAYSREAMTAVGSLSQVVSIAVNLYTIISTGGGILLAIHFGAGDSDECYRLIRAMLAGNLLFGVFVSVVSLCFTEFYPRLMHLDPSLYFYGRQYLIIQLSLSIVQSLLITLVAIFRSLGKMKTVLVCNGIVYIVCFGITASIYYLLPKTSKMMWAYTLAGNLGQTAGAAYLIWQLRHILLVGWGKEWNCEKRKENSQNDAVAIDIFEHLKKIVGYGVPAGMEGILYLFFMTIAVSIVGIMGKKPLLIRSYVGILGGYLEICLSAVNASEFVLIGQEYGREELDGVKSYFRQSIMIGEILTVISGILLLFLSSEILQRFTENQIIIQDSVSLFRFQFLLDIIKVPAAIVVSSLKAVGDTRAPLILIVPGGIILTMLAWFLGIWLEWGLFGVWIGYMADVAFRGTVLLLYWKRWMREAPKWR